MANLLKRWWPGTELNHSRCPVISNLLIPQSARSAQSALIAIPVCVLCAVARSATCLDAAPAKSPRIAAPVNVDRVRLISSSRAQGHAIPRHHCERSSVNVHRVYEIVAGANKSQFQALAYPHMDHVS